MYASHSLRYKHAHTRHTRFSPKCTTHIWIYAARVQHNNTSLYSRKFYVILFLFWIKERVCVRSLDFVLLWAANLNVFTVEYLKINWMQHSSSTTMSLDRFWCNFRAWKLCAYHKPIYKFQKRIEKYQNICRIWTLKCCAYFRMQICSLKNRSNRTCSKVSWDTIRSFWKNYISIQTKWMRCHQNMIALVKNQTKWKDVLQIYW